jgi:hypothetical protein
MDVQQLLKNRSQFPPAELVRYAGRYVAWSPKGTTIIASDEDEVRLDAAIVEAGYDTAEILISFVPHPDEVILGGGGDGE